MGIKTAYKKHWCTHQSYGTKKFPRVHHCFHKQNVSLAYKLDNVKITVEFRGDPCLKPCENIYKQKKGVSKNDMTPILETAV